MNVWIGTYPFVHLICKIRAGDRFQFSVHTTRFPDDPTTSCISFLPRSDWKALSSPSRCDDSHTKKCFIFTRRDLQTFHRFRDCNRSWGKLPYLRKKDGFFLIATALICVVSAAGCWFWRGDAFPGSSAVWVGLQGRWYCRCGCIERYFRGLGMFRN